MLICVCSVFFTKRLMITTSGPPCGRSWFRRKRFQGFALGWKASLPPLVAGREVTRAGRRATGKGLATHFRPCDWIDIDYNNLPYELVLCRRE